jgi:peptidoglycan glycosyltransferase
MMEPYLIDGVYSRDGEKIYSSYVQALSGPVVKKETAHEMRTLMKETVSSGTSRKAFRGFSKSKFGVIDVGGKTGSLTGDQPRGKYDWFVGYADYNGRKIAVSALTIHGKLWRVKSSTLARKAIETYFQDKLTPIRTRL